MSYKFYHNTQCKFYPCHKTSYTEFSCLFCFCPLYNKKCWMGSKPSQKKCEECIYPHIKSNYKEIMKKLGMKGDEHVK
jgi:Zn-finger protein